MILSSFKKEDVETRISKINEMDNEAYYIYGYWTNEADKDTFLCLFRLQGVQIEQHVLVCIPNRRATAYVELDGSMGYYPHAFDRYCERALGIDPATLSVEECAARFIFDLKQADLINLGTTKSYKDEIGYYNRAVMVWGDALLFIRLLKDSDIPYVESYVDAERVRRFPEQMEAVRLAHEGKTAEALAAFNRWVKEQESRKNKKSA